MKAIQKRFSYNRKDSNLLLTAWIGLLPAISKEQTHDDQLKNVLFN